MSPVSRPLDGSTLEFRLDDEIRTVHEQLLAGSRTARTLFKMGPLRATLVGMAAGGELARHKSDGPITVHVLEGSVEFEVGSVTHELTAGSLMALDGGVEHDVRSREGGVFLLTLAALGG